MKNLNLFLGQKVINISLSIMGTIKYYEKI